MKLETALKFLAYFRTYGKERGNLNHLLKTDVLYFPANIYLFQVNNKNTRKRCEICSTLTTKTPEQRRCFYC